MHHVRCNFMTHTHCQCMLKLNLTFFLRVNLCLGLLVETLNPFYTCYNLCKQFSSLIALTNNQRKSVKQLLCILFFYRKNINRKLSAQQHEIKSIKHLPYALFYVVVALIHLIVNAFIFRLKNNQPKCVMKNALTNLISFYFI